jgi:hypothetical protein
MTRRRVSAATAALSVVQFSAVGCTGSADDSAASTPPSSPAVPSTTPPTLAGTAEAQTLSLLPSGPATGTAVLAYSGVGELRSPFSGDCSHAADTTRVDGSADTAQIRLEVAPDAARLDMEDVGFSASGDLATGRYDVAGAHLSLDAPLVQDGQVIGSVQLEVDCGG